MSMLLILALQVAPLPPVAPSKPTPDELTKPVVSMDCRLTDSHQSEGRLVLRTSGGVAFQSDLAPTLGKQVAANIRRTEQQIHVVEDGFGILTSIRSPSVSLSKYGGDISYEATLFGRKGWWRLVIFSEKDYKTYRVEMVDADGKNGYLSGQCDLGAIAQKSLTAGEIARESLQ